MHIVAEKLGFQVLLIPIRGWDYVDANGTRQGMLGAVRKKNLDYYFALLER